MTAEVKARGKESKQGLTANSETKIGKREKVQEIPPQEYKLCRLTGRKECYVTI